MNLCAYCLQEPGNTRDHVIPQSYRRTKETVPCCQRCNSIKNNKVFDTFEAARAYVRGRRGLWIGPILKPDRNLPPKTPAARNPDKRIQVLTRPIIVNKPVVVRWRHSRAVYEFLMPSLRG